MLRAAALKGCRRFVFVSSIKVNGEGCDRPYHADDAPAPETGYGRMKLATERELSRIAGGVELVVVRPPLVHGPGARGFLGMLARAVQFAIPLPLAAATDNRRSVISRESLCQFLALCSRHPEAAGRTFLIADDPPMSTVDLLRHYGKPRLFKAPHRFLPKGARRRLFGNLEVDSTTALETMGWRGHGSSDGK
jgi:nucleoside-diphosphate-sugar epimerase